MAANQNLIRKQYLMSGENVSKVDRLAKKAGTSSAQIVRLAVEAYNPEKAEIESEQNELLDLVSERLKDAISDTHSTRTRLEKTLKKLGIE